MAKRIQKGDSVESIVLGDEPLWNTNIPITDDYLSGYIIKHTNWCNYHWDMRDYRKAVLEYLKNKKNKNMFNTISKKNSDDVSPHAYEYELNKSTGEVEKTYSRIDVISQNGNEGLHYPESLEQGTSKPNESQFDDI